MALRRGTCVRSRSGRGARRARARPGDPRGPQGQARQPGARRRAAQRLRPDGRSAVRRTRPAAGTRLDADPLGRAVAREARPVHDPLDRAPPGPDERPVEGPASPRPGAREAERAAASAAAVTARPDDLPRPARVSARCWSEEAGLVSKYGWPEGTGTSRDSTTRWLFRLRHLGESLFRGAAMADTSKRSSSRGSAAKKAASRSRNNDSQDNPELLESDEIRTAIISGVTFAAKAVQYAVIDGRGVFEGDIVLGT